MKVDMPLNIKKYKQRPTPEAEPRFGSSTCKADRQYEQCSHLSRFIFSTTFCFLQIKCIFLLHGIIIFAHVGLKFFCDTKK